MPREKEKGDYCLLVQPAVVAMKSINYYIEPQYEMTNAGVPFCLLCEEDESCISIGARIESCVIRRYNLDVAAIQTEVRSWNELCTEVIRKKKEAKEAKEKQYSWNYKDYSSTGLNSVNKRVCGTQTTSEDGLQSTSGHLLVIDQKEKEYEVKVADAAQSASSMDMQASQNLSSIVNTSHAYHTHVSGVNDSLLSGVNDTHVSGVNDSLLSAANDTPSSAANDTPSSTANDTPLSAANEADHTLSGLPGGSAQPKKDDFSDSSSSLDSDDEVAVHPELSYNQSAAMPSNASAWTGIQSTTPNTIQSPSELNTIQSPSELNTNQSPSELNTIQSPSELNTIQSPSELINNQPSPEPNGTHQLLSSS